MHPSSTMAARARLIGLAALSLSAASATAQSLMLTKGQVVAELNDAPAGLTPGEYFSTTTPFDFPAMSREGNILFRGRIGGPTATTLNDRALFIGRTKADMAVLARADTLDPSGTYPNSRMVRVNSSTGAAASSDIFNTPRISPRGNYVLFHAQLHDGGNPGLDGLIHTTSLGTVNDLVLYWGAPGSLLILAQQATTAMPGGATLNLNTINLTQAATSLNSSGKVTFKSNLLGGDVAGTTNDTAWVIGTPGTLAYFLREADLVLGGANGIEGGGLGANCVLNEAGDVLHDETLSTTLGSTPATTANDKVVMITPASTGVHSLLMREGDLAPDATGTPIPGTFYGQPTLSSGFGPSATAAFHTTMTGAVTTANDNAIFVGGLGAGSVKMVARDGDVVPGTGGETINVITLSNSSYVENHGVLFGCTLVTPGVGGVTAQNDSALVVASPTTGKTLIAREGDPAPGLPGYVFGLIAGTYNFGSSSAQRINDRGQVVFTMFVNNGATDQFVFYSWDPTHGLQPQLRAGDVMGGGTVSSITVPLGNPSGDGNSLAFNENGDFCLRGVTTGPAGQFLARGHIGSLHGTPSAVPATGGVPHLFTVECGPTQAFRFYVILATALGTEPGFTSPFGPQNIPLNPDPLWTDLSLNAANSGVWINTIGITDANGTGMGPSGFVMPPGYPGFQYTTLHHAAALLDFSLLQTFVTEPAVCYLY